MQEVYTNYIALLCACYEDIASAYPAQYRAEHRRDLLRLRRRFDYEGVSFLTKTLPSLAKAIDKALATGTVLQVPSFARRKGTKLPNFLGWLVGQVFSAQGVELVDSNPTALVHLRQLLYLFYKLELPYREEQVNEVIDSFTSTDSMLSMPWNISEPSHASEIRFASGLIHRVLGGLDTKGITPRHGPGSVATGEKLDRKAYFQRYYRHLHEEYPLDEYFYMNAAHQAHNLTPQGLKARRHKDAQLRPWKSMEHSTAKVVLVPKDSRGPRLISMEPLEIQWIQQGQCERLVNRIESHWLTKGHVNFKKQSINRYLAYWSSVGCKTSSAALEQVSRQSPGPVTKLVEITSPDRHARPRSLDLVTLDMKEASDRVSLQHLYTLFPSNWIRALEATRSSHTELPDGRVIALNKFAPMGSAVCFPVEALIFWALSLSAVKHKHPELTNSQLRERVWVYGDDIVCHREDYPVIQQSLQRTGLLLNENKCCTAGFFRESCGLDAYKGVVVTPLRISQCVPSSGWSGQHVMAYVSYSNEAYRRGYLELAFQLEQLVSANVAVPFTTVDRGLVQFVRPDMNVQVLNKLRGVRTRVSRRLHCLEAYGPTPRALLSSGHRVTYETYLARFVQKYRDTPVDSPLIATEGWFTGVTLANLTSATMEPDQYSLPRRVSSKRGWTQITI